MRAWRRHRAWELHEQGWSQKAIGAALGVTSGAVSQWMKMGRDGGASGLDAKPRLGAKSKLTPEQKQDVVALLQQGAEAHGYAGDLWTLKRVADLIKRHFGVQYHPSTMSDLLRELEWTSQQPITRATQRNEEAIAQWHEQTWPQLKKTPKSTRKRSSG